MTPEQPAPPTFAEYQNALERLRRRAHLRRAVMIRGVTASMEMPALDEEEMHDHQVCSEWQNRHGFCLPGY